MTAPVLPEQRVPEQRVPEQRVPEQRVHRATAEGQRVARKPSGRDGLGEGITGKDSETGRRRFRTDIQGLRAIAVLVVVLYHCDVPGFSGGYVGVDVFFVISGYLITQHLLTEVDQTKKVSISGFYSRRIRRLLPPALLVVAVTVVVARLYGPILQSTRTATDGLFAIFYGMNYRLAEQGVDYQQADTAPSPLQHFWSLAVEEQFYFFWPLILMVFAFLTRRLSGAGRRALLSPLLVGIIAVSLHQSITLTASNGPLAYYSLQSRAWELGVGALVAAMVPLFARTPQALAAALTWIGLALLLSPVFLFDDATAFPGYLAAIPVGGTALVIAAGLAAPRHGVDRVLRYRPVQFIGHVSYGWYLWHWPAIILGPMFFVGEFGAVEKVEMAILALWFATLSYLIIEQPTLRVRIPLRRWLVAGLGLSLVTAGTAGAAIALGPNVQGSGALVAPLDLSNPATARLAAAIGAGVQAKKIPVNLTPTLEDAATDYPKSSTDGCALDFLTVKQPPCVYGDVNADRTMVLFGDSHAQQWFGALNIVAKDNGWRLISWTKAACPVADVVLRSPDLNRDYTECGQWRAERLQAIAQMRPEVVVASQSDTLPGPAYSDSTWAGKTADTLRKLAGLTDSLVYIADTPRSDQDVPSCVVENSENVAEKCNLAIGSGLRKHPDIAYLAGREATMRDQVAAVDLTILDSTDWLCKNEVCPVIIGNLLAYRDTSHITNTYAEAVAPVVDKAIKGALAKAENKGKGTDPS